MSNSWFRKLRGSDTLEAKVETLAESLSKAESQRAELQEQVPQLEQQLATLSEELNRANVRESGLIEAVTAAEQRASEHQKKLDAQENVHRAEVRALIEAHRRELHQVQSLGEQRLEKLSRLDAHRTKLESDLQGARKQCLSLSERQHRMQQERERAGAEQQRLELEIERLQAEHQRQQSESERLQAEHQRQQSESERLQAEHQRWESENQRLRAEQQRQEGELQRLQDEQQRQEKEYQRLRAEQAAGARAVELARQSREQAERKVETVQGEWRSVVRLAALSCGAVVGERANLALELALARESRPLPAVASACTDSERPRLETLLASLRERGYVTTMETEAESIRFELSPELGEEAPVVRWVAAYLVECVGQVSGCRTRLADVEKGEKGWVARWRELDERSATSSDGAHAAAMSGTRLAVARSKTG